MAIAPNQEPHLYYLDATLFAQNKHQARGFLPATDENDLVTLSQLTAVAGSVSQEVSDRTLALTELQEYLESLFQTGLTEQQVRNIAKGLRLDEFQAPNSSLNIGGQKLENLADGVSSSDAVTVSQLYAALRGRPSVIGVRHAFEGTLSQLQATVGILDGSPLNASEDLATSGVLLLSPDGVDSGAYIWNGATFLRAADFTVPYDFPIGLQFFVDSSANPALENTYWGVLDQAILEVSGLMTVNFGLVGRGGASYQNLSAGDAISIAGNLISLLYNSTWFALENNSLTLAEPIRDLIDSIPSLVNRLNDHDNQLQYLQSEVQQINVYTAELAGRIGNTEDSIQTIETQIQAQDQLLAELRTTDQEQAGLISALTADGVTQWQEINQSVNRLGSLETAQTVTEQKPTSFEFEFFGTVATFKAFNFQNAEVIGAGITCTWTDTPNTSRGFWTISGLSAALGARLLKIAFFKQLTTGVVPEMVTHDQLSNGDIVLHHYKPTGERHFASIA